MRTRKGYIHQKGQQLYNMLEGKRTLLDCVLFCDVIYGEALIIGGVVGQSEQLCDHPKSERSYIGQNMLRCNKCGKEFS